MKVSVAMTCYNCEPYLSQAMYSILLQEYLDWEIIFVDDASTDNSYEIAKKWKRNWRDDVNIQRDDSKIMIFRREKNGGYGPCLFDAISHGTGDLIAIVDADDAIHPDALGITVDAHKKHPKASVVYSRSYWCDRNLSPYKLGPSGPIPEGHTLLSCLDGGPKTGRVSHLKILKRKYYNQTEGVGNLRKRVDKDLMLKMEEVGELVYIPEVLYYYRDHPSNLTNKFFKLPPEEMKRIMKESNQTLIDACQRRVDEINRQMVEHIQEEIERPLKHLQEQIGKSLQEMANDYKERMERLKKNIFRG